MYMKACTVNIAIYWIDTWWYYSSIGATLLDLQPFRSPPTMWLIGCAWHPPCCDVVQIMFIKHTQDRSVDCAVNFFSQQYQPIWAIPVHFYSVVSNRSSKYRSMVYDNTSLVIWSGKTHRERRRVCQTQPSFSYMCMVYQVITINLTLRGQNKQQRG